MGIETNTMGQIKALLPALQFNWSQLESNRRLLRATVPVLVLRRANTQQ
jgi:hypothetical protein